MKDNGFFSTDKIPQPKPWNSLDHISPETYTQLKKDHPGLIRLREVSKLVCLSTAWIYAKMRSGEFPRAVKIGIHSVAWRAADIYAWIESRPYA